MRKAILVLIILVGLACLWLPWRDKSSHRLTLRAYFSHAQNVRPGIPVCVDGVQLGSVEKVTVRPDLGDHPVEVVLRLGTPYELRIPSGSIAEVSQRVVLGPAIVDVDTRMGHGPPIADGGKIQGEESRDDQAALDVVLKELVEQLKELQQEQKSAGKRF